MKKTVTKALAIILCLATLVSVMTIFSSCKKEVEENKTVIVENGASEYVIIRADKAEKSVVDTIIKLQTAINDVSGIRLDIKSDWVRSQDDIDPNAKEILIGDTNRPETEETLSSLEANTWSIVNKGNKIVICANNDALIPAAIDWFIENCINESDKTVKITEKLVKTEGYGDNIPISISKVSSFQVVYPKGNATLAYYASLFERRAGISKIVTDDKAATDYEIIIGNTSRTSAATFAGQNDYSIVTEGTKVYINAANEDVLYYAVNYYLEQGMNIGETIVHAPKDYTKNATINNFFNSKWSLNIPYIEKGKISPVYNTGTGLADDREGNTLIDSYMHLVTDIEYSDFENYAKKLESFGFNKIYASKTENNDLWCYRLGGAYAYIHYAPSQKYARIILDKSSNCEVSDVDCPVEQTGTTTLYQYSIDYSDAKLNTTGRGLNCGMLYIIKLQDNSLIMVDGGSSGQLAEESMAGLYDFLYEITGLGKKESLNIKLWYFTHPDGDHNGSAANFLEYTKTRGTKAKLEALAFNYPSARANSTVNKDTASFTMIEYVNKNYPDVKYLKIHTGMVFNIGEVKVEILGTIDNLVNNKGGIYGEWDTNDTCALIRFHFGGMSVLMCGDVGNDTAVQPFHLDLYSSQYIKSDICQISHHGYNLIKDVYKACAPKYGLISNAIENVKPRTEKYNYFVQLVGLDKLYFAGDYTTAIAITNGKISIKKIPRYDNATGKL